VTREVPPRLLLPPPVFRFGSSSDFSGVSFVMSSRDTDVVKRRLGVTGLYVLIGMA